MTTDADERREPKPEMPSSDPRPAPEEPGCVTPKPEKEKAPAEPGPEMPAPGTPAS